MKYALTLPLSIIGCLLGGAVTAGAVVAKPGLVEFVQPDGTEIAVRICGDERGHYYLSEDNYILANVNDAFYYGQVAPDGRVEPTALLAHPAAQRDSRDWQLLQSSEPTAQAVKRIEQLRASSPRMARATGSPRRAYAPDGDRGDNASGRYGLFPGSAYPTKGEPRSLVVVVRYKDYDFQMSDPYDYFNRMLNEPGFDDYGALGCAADYFREMSYGKFSPQFDVYGPITLEHNRSYYGGNDWSGNDKNPHKMAIEACQILDDEVDFTQYDCDGDGVIDNIYLFYAGRGEADGGASDTVWPHSWEISSAESTRYYFDGVQLETYACSNEWEGTRADGMATFVHEFSHVLGLPDLYSTSYTGAFTPESWSILDSGSYNNGGITPPCYSVFERNALGWIDPIEINRPMAVELAPISEGQSCIIRTSQPTEFFLLENRQQEGWDEYIPGHGMLAWHIDYVDDIWTRNTVNNNDSHQYVDLVEADNLRNAMTRDGDSFPGAAGVTSWTDDTRPSMRTWKREQLGLPITEIEEADGLISFSVCGYPKGAIMGQTVPVALEASDVTSTSFVANWEPVKNAKGYVLDVEMESTEMVMDTTVVDFAKGVNSLPAGWFSTSSIAYEAEDKCGQSVPALRFALGGYIQSPEYEQDLVHLSFWHRGINSSEHNSLRVHTLADGEWMLLSEETIETAEGGQTLDYDLAAGTRAVKIEYNEVTHQGSLAIDDIAVWGNEHREIVPVAEYSGMTVEEGCSWALSGLLPATRYYYTVVAYDDEAQSLRSNRIEVVTSELGGIAAATVEPAAIRVVDGGIVAYGVGTVEVYAIDGRKQAQGQCGQRISLPSGIYVVKTGEAINKVGVR